MNQQIATVILCLRCHRREDRLNWSEFRKRPLEVISTPHLFYGVGNKCAGSSSGPQNARELERAAKKMKADFSESE